VAPDWAYNGEETPVLVTGRNFFPAVHVDATERSAADIDAQFRVELTADGVEALSLTGVTLMDYATIEARVPAGFPVGEYDLVVVSPGGATSEPLPHAFTVTDTRADHLDIEIDGAAFLVGEYAEVEVHLVDLDDEAVADSMEVVVTAASARRAVSFDLEGDGLTDMIAVDGGVRGRLGAAGVGRVALTSSLPDDVVVEVAPIDAGSWVRGDEQALSFEALALADIQVEILGDRDFVPVAGEPFQVELTLLDEANDSIEDLETHVILAEGCGGDFDELVVLTGSAVVDVTVTGATGVTCAENVLEASTGEIEGQSRPFLVDAGPLADLQVFPSTEQVVAGSGALQLRVQAVDSYGNPVTTYADEPAFTDYIAGADPRETPIEVTCGAPWTNGERICDAMLIRAAEQVRVRVTAVGHSEITGSAGPIEVLPGAPAALTLEPDTTEGVAGEAFIARTRVEDAWGNGADVNVAVTPIEVVGDAGATDCIWQAEVSPGEHRFSCVSTLAGARHLSASLASYGLEAEADSPVEIANADLASLSLAASTGQVAAGELFTLSVQGLDAFGNPYLVHRSGPTVNLSEPDGTLSPSALTLSTADGAASDSFTLTAARASTPITASHGAVTDVVALDVLPAAPDRFVVTVERPWTWVGSPIGLEVAAQDAYGNLTPEFEGPAAARSVGALFPEVEISAFDGGEASTSLIWTSAGLLDQVLVEAGAISGVSDAVDALDTNCAVSPQVTLTLDGGADSLVSCLVSGEASATATYSATAGAAAISNFHVHDGVGGYIYRGAVASSTPLHADDVGPRVIDVVVVDESACGAQDSAIWWLGEDDGSPTGPLEVTLTLESDDLTAGSTTDSATLDVEALDCAGDAADVGQPVYARASRGAFPDALSSGAGRYEGLVVTGRAELTYTVEEALVGGPATLIFGTPGTISYGEVNVMVGGDNEHPTVRLVDPVGWTDAVYDNLTVRFSEPMIPETASEGVILIEGPAGEVPIGSMRFDELGEVLTITPDAPIDAGEGIFTLTLSGASVSLSLRDEGGGNRLDGAWTGTGSDFVVRFGQVDDDELVVTTCAPALERFTPDGDPGAGEEADEVGLDLVASTAPAWWRLSLVSGTDETRVWRVAALGSKDRVTWDGRGADGAVVAPGAWTLRVMALDASDNASSPCETQVEVTQHVQAPSGL